MPVFFATHVLDDEQNPHNTLAQLSQPAYWQRQLPIFLHNAAIAEHTLPQAFISGVSPAYHRVQVPRKPVAFPLIPNDKHAPTNTWLRNKVNPV